MENRISYYELLTIIKDCEQIWEYPKVYWHNNYRDKVLYVPTFDSVSGDLEGYHLKNRNLENEDIRYWLSECMLESSMFDKCIEIAEQDITINEEDNKIGKIRQYCEYPHSNSYECWSIKEEILVNKINEIIDKINKMREDK